LAGVFCFPLLPWIPLFAGLQFLVPLRPHLQHPKQALVTALMSSDFSMGIVENTATWDLLNLQESIYL